MKHGGEDVHRNDEEERGDGISPAQTPRMKERVALESIDEHPSPRRSKQQRDPPNPARPKATLPQNTEEERPRDAIEGLGDVDLEEEGCLLLNMQSLGRSLDKQEIVLNAPAANECRLIVGDEVVHLGSEPARKHLCEEAREAVHQTNREEIRKIDSIHFFGSSMISAWFRPSKP
jgi:hypothetical protein